RSGVVEEVEADLALLARVSYGVTRWSRFGRRHDIEGLTREFSETLRAELDYVREASNAERFAAAFAGDVTVHIPRVIWPLTTHRVLTLERLRGMKVTDVAGLEAAGLDRCLLARRAATIEMSMIFEHGFFHADPHPGNFFIEADGRIGLIDFGMAGIVDARTRIGLVRILGALAVSDGEALLDALAGLGVAGPTGSRDRLRADVMRLTAGYLEKPLGELSLGPLLRDLLTVAHAHHLRLPPNLALLVKTIGMCEGVAAGLDPSFRIVSVLLPFVQHLVNGTASGHSGEPYAALPLDHTGTATALVARRHLPSRTSKVGTLAPAPHRRTRTTLLDCASRTTRRAQGCSTVWTQRHDRGDRRAIGLGQPQSQSVSGTVRDSRRPRTRRPLTMSDRMDTQ
ncbi:MAG: ABC1 kinase family protein, partial [Acidimicrobiales bacterium]